MAATANPQDQLRALYEAAEAELSRGSERAGAGRDDRPGQQADGAGRQPRSPGCTRTTASPRARKEIWPDIAEWLAERSDR